MLWVHSSCYSFILKICRSSRYPPRFPSYDFDSFLLCSPPPYYISCMANAVIVKRMTIIDAVFEYIWDEFLIMLFVGQSFIVVFSTSSASVNSTVVMAIVSTVVKFCAKTITPGFTRTFFFFYLIYNLL